MRNYETLSNQTSDILSKTIDNFNETHNTPFLLINKLPVNIMVTQENRYSNKISSRGKISAYGTLKLQSESISDGDLLHFSNYESSQLSPPEIYFVCPSHNVTKRHGPVAIGGVSSVSGTYRRDISMGGDVSSINVHNLLPWKLVIKMFDKIVMTISANVDLHDPLHHGDLTVSPYVYFDNLNQGIDIGTKFDVSILSLKNKETYLYSFVLNDIDENHIFIGLTSTLIDKSVSTGMSGNSYLPSENSGRSVYRLGSSERDFTKPVFTPGHLNYAFNAKNAAGTDKHRSSFNSNSRSTVPTARYIKLSGKNVVSGVYL